jgi:putative ABC transport system permease protein
MIKSYFLITLRSMMKNKLFVMINIIGLGLSIGVCITAFLNWKFNDQWDSQQRQAAGIYRIQSWHEVNGKSDRFGSVPVPLAARVE